MNPSKEKRRFTILLFGPQGSGKGTQGEQLSSFLDLPFIVMGNILRQHIQDKTEIGLRIQECINKGQLVPDEMTNAIINERFRKPDCERGFVLDGYPRNIVQVKALAQMTAISHLIHVAISDEEAIRRIGGRRTCVGGGHVYHILYNPPKRNGICDTDSSPLKQRDDDTEEAMKKRLTIYHEETEPLLSYYQKQNIVHTINGEQPIPDVWSDIKKIFA